MIGRARELLQGPGFSRQQQKMSGDVSGDPRIERIEPAGSVPDAAGEGRVGVPPEQDPRVNAPRSEEKRLREQSMRHPDYPGDDPEWHHKPEGRDMWHRVNKMSTIAPIQGNASLDPAAGDMIQVSYMAGLGSDAEVGFDTFSGVAEMVTGEVDASRELATPSVTPGTPLQMGPSESSYSDDVADGKSHTLALDERESGRSFAWTAEMSMHEGEPEAGGMETQSDFDYMEEM